LTPRTDFRHRRLVHRHRRHKRRRSSPANDAGTVRFAGSSVNLPDMAATLKAKIAVSHAEQSNPEALARVYDAMATKLVSQGLDLAACCAIRQYFGSLHTSRPIPLLYAQFPVPLPPGAVRLSVVFFKKAAPDLAQLVLQAATDIVSCLPHDVPCHINDQDHYHITIFMTSQPHTLRPNPFISIRSDGDVFPPELSPEEIYSRAAPAKETVDREIEVMREAAKSTTAPTFRVHRVFLADSGTLLLTCVDVSGQVAGLRQRLQASFPGAPPRQSTIFHASLARVLVEKQLDARSIARIHRKCEEWTSSHLRGAEFQVTEMHYVQEERFTTVDGPVIALPFDVDGCKR
jgi:hypothetical protein